VLSEIDWQKDVDGLHPLNMGSLVLKGRTPAAVACTPKVGATLHIRCTPRIRRSLCAAPHAPV